MSDVYDIAVVGGGILGCGTALHVAHAGMRPIVVEQGDIGQGASGVNAGTLSLQIKRVKLIPYAVEGLRRWERMGDAVGFRRTGGYTLAFTGHEAGLLRERMTLKRAAGADIRLVRTNELRDVEPGLSGRVVAASYCPDDGYADASLSGRFYRGRLREAGVVCRERCRVVALERTGDGFDVMTAQGAVRARLLLLATGGWTRDAAAMLGVALPVRARVNTVSVTERTRPLFGTVIGHATGLLTMKQKANGTVLIGGGWQGRGTPGHGRGEVLSDQVIANVALARYAVPALGLARVVRSWTGFEANVPDFYPLAGSLPGVENACVLACVRGGYTIGPYIAGLMGELILGREPEMPLFDPGRDFTRG